MRQGRGKESPLFVIFLQEGEILNKTKDKAKGGRNTGLGLINQVSQPPKGTDDLEHFIKELQCELIRTVIKTNKQKR